MTVTVVSTSGLDTKDAKIEALLTRKDATAFCTEYLMDPSEKCVAEAMTKRLEPSITANCETGVFKNFTGHWHQFLGPKNLMYGDTTGA